MEERKKGKKISLGADICIVLLAFNLLMPVSNARNTLNSGMTQFAYVMLLITVCFLVFCQNRVGRNVIKINMVQLSCNVIYILILLIASLITRMFNPGLEFRTGELLRYLVLFFLLNFNPKKIGHPIFFKAVYTLVSFIIIFVGFFEAIGISFINEFLRTYYVNHYAHVYTVMIQANKTVTFFATHSIAAFIYLFMFLGWDFYSKTRKSMLSIICRIGFFILIVLCKSVSSVFCCGILAIYYLIKFKERITKKFLLFICVVMIVGFCWIIRNFSVIESILQSEGNGILGRYIGGASKLGESLKYIFSFGIPSGLYNLDGLEYTDSGYVVYALRGGFGFLIVLYYMLYKLLKRVTANKNIYRTFFFCILLFDAGYTILISQRFVAAFLLTLYFVSVFCSNTNNEVQ